MISAFVITCDKHPQILTAVVKSARFVNEVIVIDKGKFKFQPPNVDKYITTSWSPTVEETRSQALRECSHDWIICLDDDEILSSACEATFRDFVSGNQADVLQIPIKHYILGRHDPNASYWPEWRPVLFRRGSVEFRSTVHAGTNIIGRTERLHLDHPAFITHLSHPNVSSWIEKTNRYTSQPDRSSSPNIEFHGDYVEAIGLLHEIYRKVDVLKRWEEAQGFDGKAEFLRIARESLK